MTLLGDAGYCPSPAAGLGTSMALVGAYVLGDAMRHEDGFGRYERALRPYVEKNLACGGKMAGDMVPGGRWTMALRTFGMRTLRFNPWKRQIIEQVTRPLHVAANAITL
ncbi:hypothetical protein [Actinoplanes sp. TFC3]|uniref:hypothetical protein n=1 Tax=Actinoplanes sp. TFC3 TaxID=1710355 RepID=UPI0008326C59|nr:hypothetical protein [Actinoplanes sp. TFC3]